MEDHRAAVRYDLLRHGYRLEWVGTQRLPWGDAVAVIDKQPPAGSAVYRELYPDDHDRDRTVRTLEMTAVLVARLHQQMVGIDPADQVTRYAELVSTEPTAPESPAVAGFSFAEIDKLMSRGE